MTTTITVCDAVNAVFELGGAVLLTLNVRRLWKDKKLSGVSIFPTMWFNMWGAWNLDYYHKLGQYWSWYAGMPVFLMNTAWVALAVYYWLRTPAPEQLPPMKFTPADKTGLMTIDELQKLHAAVGVVQAQGDATSRLTLAEIIARNPNANQVQVKK